MLKFLRKIFVQIFYKFLKIFQKSLMSTFLLNVPANRNFGDSIAVQDLSGILSDVFPLEPKSLSRYWYNCTLYITVVLGSTVFERAENGNAVLCIYWYIDFDVIFQKKLYSTNFIINWLRAGPKNNFAGRAENFGPVDTSTFYNFVNMRQGNVIFYQ